LQPVKDKDSAPAKGPTPPTGGKFGLKSALSAPTATVTIAEGDTISAASKHHNHENANRHVSQKGDVGSGTDIIYDLDDFDGLQAVEEPQPLWVDVLMQRMSDLEVRIEATHSVSKQNHTQLIQRTDDHSRSGCNPMNIMGPFSGTNAAVSYPPPMVDRLDPLGKQSF